MFSKTQSLGARVLVLAAVSLLLIGLDYNTQATGPTRTLLSYLSAPFYAVARTPMNIIEGVDAYFTSRDTLIVENERLHNEARILHGKLQKFVSLTAENVRLRQLLSSSTLLEDSVLIAELVNVSPDPLKQLIMIDKGEKDGVYIGQAVIDAYGLVGQVVEVNAIQSTVILISDSRHALPVQINRNGVRAIAEGSGRIDTLWLPNLVSTTDIQVGDLIVSSGLGQRFPIGYPVGVVETVKRDPGQAFLKVAVRPSAELDRSRFVLLVFAGEASL
ncbi:MAG: rod shape-determining protein MreC [Cellvibrionales bacterium]|nr:rod shape-determining protein MreC [Cellvibrionales bacterium]